MMLRPGFVTPRASGIGGNDAFTVLLLHCDGADGSTTFPDSSASAHTVTANGNAQVDTAQSVFGGASLFLDGSGDFLSIPDSNDWDFGTSDFTVDFRVRLNSTARQTFIGQHTGSNGWVVQYNSGSLLFFWGNSILASAAWTPSTGVWYHIAVVRTSGVLRFFVNGSKVGSDTSITTNLSGSSSDFLVGALAGVGQYTNGWMGEVRVSKGIARWTSNFTPPTQPYS